jgi:hypothetical protein
MQRIGTVELISSTTFHDASYECAAWWRKVACKPQGVTLFHDPRSTGYVQFTLQGTRDADNFQSLWCGSRIGEPYNEKQNAGSPDEYTDVCV